MSFRDDLERQGSWLFRHRSYLPLIFLPLVIIALKDSEYIETTYGDLADDIWEAFCVFVSFLGLFVRCLTIGFVPEGTSGRNTRHQKADRLNTTGMYSIVRHPLYLGNFLIMLGLVMFTQVGWLILISILAFWIYYERIIFAEETFLSKKFGNSFSEWASKTPVFLPKINKWQKPDLPFSLKTVLRREYTGLFVITTSFVFLEISGDAIVYGNLDLDTEWMALFLIGLSAYLVLRTLKKKTRLLHVKGR